MDPYCMVKYRDQKLKTPIHKSGGLYPYWNHTLTFEVSDLNDRLLITAYNKDAFVDEIIGSRDIKLSHLVQS